MSRRLVANTLKAAVARRMVKKRHAVNFELGLCKRGKLRADAISMTMYGEFTIFEVKSCTSDFLTDEKCDQYLKYCHKFYFVFEEKTWNKLKEKVAFPPKVGVIIYTETRDMRVVRKSRRQEMEPKIHQQLILRMAYRAAEFRSLRQVNLWAKANL